MVSLREQMTEAVDRAAVQAGFDLAGVTPVRAKDYPESEAFAEWVAAGHAGEMKYMEKRSEDGQLRRASAKNATPWARSVVICALNYNTSKPYSTEVADPRRGWISRYAWGAADYHDVLLPRLRQVEAALQSFAAERNLPIETRSYVDTGPLLERMYARYAAIGWSAKNTCIINQTRGSWLFLGAVVTSLDIEEGGHRQPPLPPPDRCGSCTRCIDACPTQAIVAPGNLDARRCIAYLTIEKRGEIPEKLRGLMGHHVFGCDICQDVCPWNRKPNKEGSPLAGAVAEFQARENLFHPDLKWLASLDQTGFREVFRGSPVKRAKYAGLRRNVAVAMGNSGNRDFIPDLEKMATDSDPVVARHAQWALRKLRSPASQGESRASQ
ncbi:MAG TPA: tRNA epoxyqueuosine(34) reductase QueG [Terriglobales bacterium]